MSTAVDEILDTSSLEDLAIPCDIDADCNNPADVVCTWSPEHGSDKIVRFYCFGCFDSFYTSVFGAVQYPERRVQCCECRVGQFHVIINSRSLR